MKTKIKRLRPVPTKFPCYPYMPKPYNRPSQEDIDEARLVFNNAKYMAIKQIEEDLKESLESDISETKKQVQAKQKEFLESALCREYVENLLSIIPKKCLVYIKEKRLFGRFFDRVVQRKRH